MREWLIAYPRAIPTILFLAIAAIAALSAYVIEDNERQNQRVEAEQFAQSIATALDRRGNGFSSYLRAGAALFSTIDEVSLETFRQFVAELRVDQNYRGAEGIGWIQTIAPEGVDAFLARVRREQPGYPDIRPLNDTQREVIAPVTYFSPDTIRNSRALGFDMYSEAARAAAMDEAKRTVQPTASGRIVLSQEGAGAAPGFVIVMPVYRSLPNSPTLERELTGYVFSAFDAGEFLDGAIDVADPTEFGVRLYDGEAASSNLLVSRSLESEGGDKFQMPVTIANRDFQLVIEAKHSGALAPMAMLTLIFGLALASLLALIVRLLAKQALEDQTRLAFFEEQHSIRNSLSRELNHRVKNTLANVLSILSLTRRRSDDLDEFADSLTGRIQALSATHDLLTGTEWARTPIKSVIEAEMQHISAAKDHTVHVDGPDVELAPSDALSFGLAIHELATNAAKFGALSVRGGNVDVRWHLVSDTLAEVQWTEQGGPAVPTKRSRGFGTDLIEKIVAHELKHAVDLEFHREGVRCVFRVPVRQFDDFQMREADQAD